MKISGVVVLTCLTLLVATALFYEVRENHLQGARLAAVEKDDAVQRSATREHEAAAEGLRQQKATLAAKLAHDQKALGSLREKLASAASQAPAAATPALASEPDAARQPAGGSMGKLLGQMMKDPAMKQMMRSQQASALRTMYGDLVKQWSLSPEESDTFYGLLLDKQMSMIDAGQNYMAGTSSAAAVAATTQDYDAQLKATLGDDLFNQYQTYERTVGDRALLSRFQAQLASSGDAALTPDQSNLLMSAMTEERQAESSSATPAFASAVINSGKLDQQAVDSFVQQQTEINQRVDQRLVGVLNAAQLDALQTYQTQMLETQKTGMSMAAKMMGGP